MEVMDWLLEADLGIRWQVRRDLLDEPEEVIAADRAKVADEGWGARLLSLRDSDGQWAGGAFWPKDGPSGPGQPWTATLFTLVQLKDLGLDPDHPKALETAALVRENSKWEHDGQRFFDGEVEPCINGRAVGVGAYFGEDVSGIVDRLLNEQMDDGGWNCEQENGSTRGSFHTTINVLEGLLDFERHVGGSPEITEARDRGEEYLLERRLLRRASTGEIIDDAWTLFSYPPRWRYDVLRALDHLRDAGVEPDERIGEAIALVEEKRGDDGTWLLDRTHRGDVHFHMEDEGHPSRWNTLRAMRVLRWGGRGDG